MIVRILFRAKLTRLPILNQDDPRPRKAGAQNADSALGSACSPSGHALRRTPCSVRSDSGQPRRRWRLPLQAFGAPIGLCVWGSRCNRASDGCGGGFCGGGVCCSVPVAAGAERDVT